MKKGLGTKAVQLKGEDTMLFQSEISPGEVITGRGGGVIVSKGGGGGVAAHGAGTRV